MAKKEKTAWKWFTSRDFFWPSIVDLESAKVASKQGCWAAVFIAIVTAVFAILGNAGIHLIGTSFDLWVLVDAALFSVIAYFIYKQSRIASVFGLSIYILERIDMWMSYGPRNPAMVIIISLMFINSIRGTFAIRRFQKARKANAFIDDSFLSSEGHNELNIEAEKARVEEKHIREQKKYEEKIPRTRPTQTVCPSCGMEISSDKMTCDCGFSIR